MVMEEVDLEGEVDSVVNLWTEIANLTFAQVQEAKKIWLGEKAQATVLMVIATSGKNFMDVLTRQADQSEASKSLRNQVILVTY